MAPNKPIKQEIDAVSNQLRMSISSNDEQEPLSELLRSVVHVLIDYCFDQLNIEKSSFYKMTKLDNEPISADYLSIDQRYNFTDLAIMEQKKKYKIGNISCDFARLQYLVRLILHVLKIGTSQIYYSGHWDDLQDLITNLQKMIDDDKDILLEASMKKQEHAFLLHKLEEERSNFFYDIKNCENDILNMVNVCENTRMDLLIEMNYIQQWENSRRQQNCHKENMEERKLLSSNVTIQKDSDKEILAHKNIKRFIDLHNLEVKEKIANWMVKYDKDLEETENNITNVTTRVSALKEKMERLQATYEKRDIEVEEYLIFRKEKQKMMIRNFRENVAARKIQNWWRKFVKKPVLMYFSSSTTQPKAEKAKKRK